MFVIVIMVIFAVIGGFWASSKNLNPALWAVVCGLFPVIGVVVLAFMKPGEADANV